jgi:hypothetical protein
MQRKSRRGRGRPLDTKESKDSKSAARKRDGDRVRIALRYAGFRSEAEAARRAGIPQGSLNGIVNGERGINREDLRKLGSIGIPAGYVLGHTNDIVPPGQSRTRAELVGDLFAEIQRRLVDRGITLEDLPTGFDSDSSLEGITTIVEEDLKHRPTYRARMNALIDAALAVENALGVEKVPPLVREQLTEARQQLNVLARELAPEVRIFGGYIFDSLEGPAEKWGTKIAVPRRKGRA